MSKCFRPGLKYVFTKKKFLKSERELNYKDKNYKVELFEWVKKLNGRRVIVTCGDDGKIEALSCDGETMINFVVVPQWCKCVGDSND